MTSYQNSTLSSVEMTPMDRRRRILIVDDDEPTRRMLGESLEQEGYQVELAEDGRHALEIASSFLRDLILLDVKMPDLDGLEVARRLHAKSNVPLRMLSALTDDIDRVAGLSAGSDDYVTKPVRPRELLLRMQALLRRVEASESADPPLEGDLRFDDLVIRPRLHVVERDGRPIALIAHKFDLLYFLP